MKRIFRLDFGQFKVGLEFKLPDMWVGLFWKTSPNTMHGTTLDVWLCLLPTLPIHFEWHGDKRFKR